jgi:hypothetical protein
MHDESPPQVRSGNIQDWMKIRSRLLQDERDADHAASEGEKANPDLAPPTRAADEKSSFAKVNAEWNSRRNADPSKRTVTLTAWLVVANFLTLIFLGWQTSIADRMARDAKESSDRATEIFEPKLFIEAKVTEIPASGFEETHPNLLVIDPRGEIDFEALFPGGGRVQITHGGKNPFLGVVKLTIENDGQEPIANVTVPVILRFNRRIQFPDGHQTSAKDWTQKTITVRLPGRIFSGREGAVVWYLYSEDASNFIHVGVGDAGTLTTYGPKVYPVRIGHDNADMVLRPWIEPT